MGTKLELKTDVWSNKELAKRIEAAGEAAMKAELAKIEKELAGDDVFSKMEIIPPKKTIVRGGNEDRKR